MYYFMGAYVGIVVLGGSGWLSMSLNNVDNWGYYMA